MITVYSGPTGICATELEPIRASPFFCLPCTQNPSTTLSQIVIASLVPSLARAVAKSSSSRIYGTHYPPFGLRRLFHPRTFQASFSSEKKEGIYIPVMERLLDLARPVIVSSVALHRIT
jgi:hypothetical protein